MDSLNHKQEIKSFHKDIDNSRPSNPNKIKRADKIPLEVGKVTSCLTPCHNECSGTYIDSTAKFVINCLCKCHNKLYKSSTKGDCNKI